jgi:hypothetical protein
MPKADDPRLRFLVCCGFVNRKPAFAGSAGSVRQPRPEPHYPLMKPALVELIVSQQGLALTRGGAAIGGSRGRSSAMRLSGCNQIIDLLKRLIEVM